MLWLAAYRAVIAVDFGAETERVARLRCADFANSEPGYAGPGICTRLRGNAAVSNKAPDSGLIVKAAVRLSGALSSRISLTVLAHPSDRILQLATKGSAATR